MTTKIKLFLTDVDGVMTDAGMYYTESGDEFKKFNTHDGMAFNLLREAGIKTGMITTETTTIVERRAKKLKVDYLYQGAGFTGKLQAASEICEKENISLMEVAYIGGLAACPSNSTFKVKAIKGIIHLKKSGGDGAIREFVDEYILNE